MPKWASVARRLGETALVCCALANVAGCSSAPPVVVQQPPLPPPPPAPPRAARSDPVAVFERDVQQHAQRQAQRACWADAAVAYEILTVLRPDTPTYRQQLDEVRRQINALLPPLLERAAAARRRGELAAAERSYLDALALQPDHAQSLAALREIDIERNRRAGAGSPTARLLPPAPARSVATRKGALVKPAAARTPATAATRAPAAAAAPLDEARAMALVPPRNVPADERTGSPGQGCTSFDERAQHDAVPTPPSVRP